MAQSRLQFTATVMASRALYVGPQVAWPRPRAGSGPHLAAHGVWSLAGFRGEIELMIAFFNRSKHILLPRRLICVLGSIGCIFLSLPSAFAQKGKGDVIYVPTPEVTVNRLLEMAEVTSRDFLIDLGSGDGRIVITAAKKYGARGLGVDLDPVLVQLAKDNAWREGVRSQVDFVAKNIFDTDVSQASIVAVYLSPELNRKLRPRLLAQLQPGSRVISHDYGMDDWAPEQSEMIEVPGKTAGAKGESMAYLWIVPANVIGTWEVKLGDAQSPLLSKLELNQILQKIHGSLEVGRKAREIGEAKLRGDQIEFTVEADIRNEPVTYEFSGRVEGRNMRGEVTVTQGGEVEEQAWTARRITPLRPLDSPPGSR